MRTRAFVLLVLAAAPARAQSAPGETPKQEPIVRSSDAAILGVALAGSALLMKYDVRITAWKGYAPFQNSSRVRNTFNTAAFLGGPGSIAIDAALWGAGRIAKNKDLATDGETALEAAALSGAVTFLLKGVIGRARPLVDSTRADNFSFGRGFSAGFDYQSFPSGHTTAAFDLATAVTMRLAERKSPSVAWAAPVLFGVATLTDIARVYTHHHWATDCLMGAAIGTVGGFAAARWHERHP